jgi:hypothetical protein
MHLCGIAYRLLVAATANQLYSIFSNRPTLVRLSKGIVSGSRHIHMILVVCPLGHEKTFASRAQKLHGTD